MRWSEITVYVTIVLALALWWVWVAASRLDRLHRKVGTSRAVLDAFPATLHAHVEDWLDQLSTDPRVTLRAALRVG